MSLDHLVDGHHHQVCLLHGTAVCDALAWGRFHCECVLLLVPSIAVIASNRAGACVCIVVEPFEVCVDNGVDVRCLCAAARSKVARSVLAKCRGVAVKT